MADGTTDRVGRHLFGTEGEVVGDQPVQLMVASAAVAASGAFIISPILSEVAGPLGASAVRAGLLMTAFTLPPTVLVPILGVLADRIGRRPVFVPSMLLFGLAGTAIAFVETFEQVLVLRAVQGVAYAGIMPLTVALLGDLYEGTRESTAQGVRVSGIHVVSTFGSLLAGVLVLASWRVPFLLFAAGIAVAAWAWLSFPDVDLSTGDSLESYLRDLTTLLGEPAMLLVVVSFGLRFTLVFGFLTYVSVLAADAASVTVVFGGLLVSVWGAASLLTSSQVGRITSRIDPITSMVGGFLAGGAGIAVMGVWPHPAVMLAGVVLLGLAGGVTGPVQKSLVNRFAAGHLRGGAVSAGLIFQNVGRAAGPVVTGMFVQRIGVREAFVTLGVSAGGLGALAFVTVWLLSRQH